jgi:hypothetical protein
MPDRGQAGDGRQVASKEICSTLDAAFRTKGPWAAGNRERNPGFGPEDGESKSATGESKSARGITKAWHQVLGKDSGSPVCGELIERRIVPKKNLSGTGDFALIARLHGENHTDRDTRIIM